MSCLASQPRVAFQPAETDKGHCGMKVTVFRELCLQSTATSEVSRAVPLVRANFATAEIVVKEAIPDGASFQVDAMIQQSFDGLNWTPALDKAFSMTAQGTYLVPVDLAYCTGGFVRLQLTFIAGLKSVIAANFNLSHK
jgi:hypothetical protein